MGAGCRTKKVVQARICQTSLKQRVWSSNICTPRFWHACSSFLLSIRPEIIGFSANGYNETTRDVVVAWKGHIIDFVCKGNGNPVPTVTVTHGNESSLSQLAGGGTATGKFIVTNASSVDDGTYVCQAENKVDSPSMPISL